MINKYRIGYRAYLFQSHKSWIYNKGHWQTMREREVDEFILKMINDCK